MSGLLELAVGAHGGAERWTELSEIRWARAAHHCDGHREFDGITLATRRRVVPRTDGRALPGPTLVWIRLDEVRPR